MSGDDISVSANRYISTTKKNRSRNAPYHEVSCARIGDSTKTYFATHPHCKSSRQAKERGRALCKLPEVMLELNRLRTQSLDGTDESHASIPVFSERGSSASKLAWENELHLLTYSKVNIRKIPVNEKLLALRTLGESNGWLDKRQPQEGIRATFNFHLGPRKVVTSGVTRTLVVDSGASPRAIIERAPDAASLSGIGEDAKVLDVPTDSGELGLFGVDNT